MKIPFTKVIPFSLTQTMTWSVEALELLLSQKTHQEIRPEQLRSSGFVCAISGDTLVEPLQRGVVFIRYKITEKNIPKTVIRKKADEQAEDIFLNEQRKLTRQERVEIEQRVIAELLPHAFPKDTIISAILTPTHIFVESGSAKRAEDLLSALRGCLGSLPVQVLCTEKEIESELTSLITEQTTWGNFGLGERFKAKHKSNSKSVLSGTHMDLGRKDLLSLITGERKVSELELTYEDDEGVSTWFILTKDGALKGIAWPPELSDLAMEDAGEEADTEVIWRATLLLIAASLQDLIEQICAELGGEVFGPGETERGPDQKLVYAALGTLGEMKSALTGKHVLDTETRANVLDIVSKFLAEHPGFGFITDESIKPLEEKHEWQAIPFKTEPTEEVPDSGAYDDVDDLI